MNIFSSQEVYGEVWVRKNCAGVGLRAMEDKSFYLHMILSFCISYESGLDGIGYKVKKFCNGKYYVKRKDEGGKFNTTP